MKPLDLYLQSRRFAMAKRFIRPQSIVLDVGSADGVLFKTLATHIRGGIGIDSDLPHDSDHGTYRLIQGHIPGTPVPNDYFDCVTMLAVLEHIPRDSQPDLVQYCHAALRDQGRVIITVPSPLVDMILTVLQWLRIVDAMSLHQHYAYNPAETTRLFSAPLFKLVHRQRFQLGLNNLFVFEKINTTHS